MTTLAPLLSDFLQTHLPKERSSSRHTVATYAHCYTLLLRFASDKLSKRPTDLTVEDIDPHLVLSFLDHVERERSNGTSTRNARLAAVRALFKYIEFREPSCLDQCLRMRSIPRKRADERLIHHLTRDEVKALLNAPDSTTVTGIRDRAMLQLCYSAGLRVGELLSVRMGDFPDRELSTIHIVGKGRRERVLPLWKATRQALSAWLERRPRARAPELFLNKYGVRMSRDGFALRLKVHVGKAAERAPSMENKTVTPHSLRHSCAVHTLAATRDIRKVALWLGHSSVQTTEQYLRVDAIEKLAVMNAVVPPTLEQGKFKAPSDQLMDMLGKARSVR